MIVAATGASVTSARPGTDQVPMSTRERPRHADAPTELLGPPGAPPEEPPPERELWPWLLVLIVLVLAGLTAAWFATRDSGGTPSPETLTTTVAAAPAKPKAKPKATPATTQQARTVLVPQLVGQRRDEAVHTLEAQGLRADVHEVPSLQTERTVVSQHPIGGTRVDAGSGVLLNVAQKVEKKPAEPKKSKHKEKEKQKGKGKDKERENASSPTRQAPQAEPEATTTEPEATTTVSSGASQTPATATVPSVVGEDEGTARAELIDAGLTPVAVDQDTTVANEAGTVVDQSPTGGSSAQPNSQVTIYVARYTGG
jgi:beta-lactam-binding protein with PASTA domain